MNRMFQGNLNAGREAAFPGLLMLGAGEGGLAAWSSYQSLCPSGPSPYYPPIPEVLAAEWSCQGRDVGRGARLPGTKCYSEPSVTAFEDSATKRESWDFRRSES